MSNIVELPRFITFTGVDENTPIRALLEIQEEYPVEWGVLFSPERQGIAGHPRYPSIDFIADELLEFRRHHAMPLKVSAHLCGGHSKKLLSLGYTNIDSFIRNFDRVQVNSSDRNILPARIANWWGDLADSKTKPILQCRGGFPSDGNVSWLFDCSGGMGIYPEDWPFPNIHTLSGYAGGINPSNVVSTVKKIGAATGDYWLDMESGVRDKNDNFSVDLCRQVCKAVYG